MKLNDIVLHRTNADRLAGGQFEDIAVPTDNPNLVHVTGKNRYKCDMYNHEFTK
ncbi:hypothetical protein JYU34_011689 [Plutella xylostella]|uniref:Uncharacterized protein n=1 Tax=Plutella xylostella TaxID=51655 RepID=A0ABQ7QDC0_PLUXY|nr:hypothetical protein JYU34_011689 [Plutella xylostella]